MKLKKLLALALAGVITAATLTACTPLDAAELVYDSIFGGGSSSTGSGTGSTAEDAENSAVAEGVAAEEALRTSLAYADLADRLGYHRFWTAEHHGSPLNASAAPEALAAHLLARTRRIRIGTGGVLIQQKQCPGPVAQHKIGVGHLAQIFHIFHAQGLAIPHAFAIGIRCGCERGGVRAKTSDVRCGASGIQAGSVGRAGFRHDPVVCVQPFGTHKNPGVTGLPPGSRMALRRCAERRHPVFRTCRRL